MKKTQLLFVNLLLVVQAITAQPLFNFEWAQISKDYYPKSTVIDKNGNIYVAGDFYSDSLDVDMTSGVHLLRSKNNYNSAFLVKYDANRNYLWAKEIKGNTIRISTQVYLNHDESSVCVLGEYRDSLFGNPSAGIPNRYSAGGRDVYIARYNSSSGNLERLSSLGTAATEEYPIKAQFDKNGNQYVYWSQFANGSRYLFVTKINSNYTMGYNFDMGSSNANLFGTNMGLDSNANVIICGWHTHQSSYKSAVGQYSNLNVSTNGKRSVFVIQIGSNGIANSAKQHTMYNTDILPTGLAVAKSGEIYLSLNFHLGIYPDLPGAFRTNAFLFHYDKTHTISWTARITDINAHITSPSLAVDDESNVILSGIMGGSTQIITHIGSDWDKLIDTAKHSKSYTPIVKPFNENVFLIKIQNNANISWIKVLPIPGGYDNFEHIGLKGNDIYVTGKANGIIRPVPGSLSNEINLGNDVAWFMIKYNQEWGANIHKDGLSKASLCVYPNPCKNVLNISAQFQIQRLEIFGINGQRVLELNPNISARQFEVGDLENGLYIIKAYDQQQVYQTKFMVNR